MQEHSRAQICLPSLSHTLPNIACSRRRTLCALKNHAATECQTHAIQPFRLLPLLMHSGPHPCRACFSMTQNDILCRVRWSQLTCSLLAHRVACCSWWRPNYINLYPDQPVRSTPQLCGLLERSAFHHKIYATGCISIGV